MKKSILSKLDLFKQELQTLKKDISNLEAKTVNRPQLRNRADAIATMWVEELRSPLEHKFHVSKTLIEKTAAEMKQLHVLSRPSNLKTSYLSVINATLKQFDDKFTLPIKQSPTEVEGIFDLQKLVPGLIDPEESDYLKEAVECAQAGHKRAAIVLGWCALIDKIQKHIVRVGLHQFNAASTKIKNQTSGKFKNWNKEFSVATLSELQTVFDTDLLVVLEGMNLIDGNQAERLRTCFQYRNHSAHPGEAPIEDAHVVAFFSDVNAIVLQNPAFSPPE
jgi:hypothetical protein